MISTTRVLVRKLEDNDVFAQVTLTVRRADITTIDTKLETSYELQGQVVGAGFDFQAAVECAMFSGIGFALRQLGSLFVTGTDEGMGYQVITQATAGMVLDPTDTSGFALAAAIAVAYSADRVDIITRWAMDGWQLEECDVNGDAKNPQL